MTLLIRCAPLLVVVVAIGHCNGLRAQEPTLDRKIGNETYHLQLAFQDNFDNLDDWLIESTGKVSVQNNHLVWDCFASGKQAGTIWCRKKFSGPTVVEFDAIAEAGARNLNFILYATHPNGLLETTSTRTGQYRQYHVFSNYIITYLTPPVTGDPNLFSEVQWRIRFRKNPGFNLLSERIVDSTKPASRNQRITYVLDGNGRMSLFVDGVLMHAHENRTSPYRSGYHGFRTWNSDVRYSDFKVYSLLPPQ